MRVRVGDLRLQGSDARVDRRLLVRRVVRCRRTGGDQCHGKPDEGERSPSHRSSFAHGQVDPPPTFAGQRLERRRHVPAKRADLCAVVLVGDGAGAVVELELLQRRERAVALLEQREPPPLVVVELVERVRLGLGLPQEGKRDRDDARHGERGTEQQRQGQRVAGMPTSEARATSRRCSRRSGHSVMREPTRKTSPASQMRFTSGLTKTRK